MLSNINYNLGSLIIHVIIVMTMYVASVFHVIVNIHYPVIFLIALFVICGAHATLESQMKKTPISMLYPLLAIVSSFFIISDKPVAETIFFSFLFLIALGYFTRKTFRPGQKI